MSPAIKATEREVAAALDRLHDLAEQTRAQMREVLRMTEATKLTMTYSKLFAADEALGNLARLERKPKT